MDGIDPKSRDIIDSAIEELFDKVAFDLLGNIPHLKDKKLLVISSRPNMGLGHLFLRVLGSDRLLPKEEQILKQLLDTAYQYIDALKMRTKANLINSLNSYITESRIKKQLPSTDEINKRIIEELRAAGQHLSLIAAAESNKAKNVGTALKIAKIASDQRDDNPSVAFIVVRDDRTCDECKKLHLLEDGITPRVWKLSEIGYHYHKKGENNPKIGGLHPRCRCQLTFIPKSFGFRNGRLEFIELGYDEFKKQRESI